MTTSLQGTYEILLLGLKFGNVLRKFYSMAEPQLMFGCRRLNQLDCDDHHVGAELDHHGVFEALQTRRFPIWYIVFPHSLLPVARLVHGRGHMASRVRSNSWVVDCPHRLSILQPLLVLPPLCFSLLSVFFATPFLPLLVVPCIFFIRTYSTIASPNMRLLQQTAPEPAVR